MLQSIEEMWKSYSSAVMPNDAGLVQRMEMMKSFYAGVNALFHEYKEIASNENISEGDGVVYLERIGAELRMFSARIKKGGF